MVEVIFLGCQRQGSNLRQMPYEDTALPLSYAGIVFRILPDNREAC